MYIGIYFAELSLCCWGLGLSNCGEWGLLSSCVVHPSHCGSFSCCEAWALGDIDFSNYGMCAQQLWNMGSRACGLQQSCFMGLVAPGHVKYSQIRDSTHVLCIPGGFLTTGPPGKSRTWTLILQHRQKFNTKWIIGLDVKPVTINL